MQSIHIVEDSSKRKKLSGVDYLTPQEAEGEIVEFEIPGTMGQELYRIDNVNLDKQITTLTNIITGEQYAADNSILPPDYSRFSRPKVGREYSVYWKEHMDGSGEWVQTTPKVSHKRDVNIYYGHYTGHENTRVVEKTMEYKPPHLLGKDIKCVNGEPTIFIPDGERSEEVDKILRMVDEDSINAYTDGGTIYFNSDYEVEWYNIRYDLTDDANYKAPYMFFDNKPEW